MMGRSGSAFILVFVICSSLLLHSSSSSSSQGFGGRKLLGGIDTGVVFVPYNDVYQVISVEGTGTGSITRKLMSAISNANKDAVEVMDYSDPGANINPENGFLGSPPPPPTPT